MTACANTNDKRAKARHRVLLSGKLAYAGGFSADCPIRDESETGARVTVGAALLPRDVVLVSVSRGVAYEAQVVWRKGREAGLRFDRAHPMKPPETDQTPHDIKLARRLWVETTAR